ncbi:MAG: hypothetical protein AB8U93_08295 [Francisella endosymbiont of Hyalomma scupense]
MDTEFKYWKLIQRNRTLQKDYNLIKYKDKEFYLSDRRATNGELRSDNIVNYIQINPQKTMKDVASDPTNFIDFAFRSKLSLFDLHYARAKESDTAEKFSQIMIKILDDY